MNILQSVFIKFLWILSKIIKKEVIYINSVWDLWNNAIISKFWFWYTWNIYDYKDIAYWIANNWEIEREWIFVKNIIENMSIENKNIIFYDIWANTWYFWILSNHLGKWKIITHFFEPIKEHIDCIKKSIYLNRFDNTSFIHEIWLSNEDSSKTFYLAWSGSSLEEDFNWSNSKKQINIQINKLDNYINEQKIEKPNFLKIDVEWHEYDVLLWAKETIESNLPVIYIEIAKNIKNTWVSYNNIKFNDTIDFIKLKWYKIYTVIDNTSIEEFKYDNEISTWVIMYLCLHTNNHKKLISIYENK